MIADSPLARAFWEKGKVADCPVFDMHGHMGPVSGIWFPRGAPEQMVHSMDRAGVRLLCFCPHDALFMPESGNRTAIDAVRKFPDRLRAYAAINPNYPELIARNLAEAESLPNVFVGIKLLPDYHRRPLTDAAYEPALRVARDRNWLVLTHTWGDSRYSGPDQVRRFAAANPDVQLILGHSLHGAWDEAVAIAREFPNTWLDLTAVLDNDRGVLEKFAEAGLARRMLFGTDLPWFSPHMGIGAILSADLTDEDRHDILQRNAQRLLAGRIASV